MTVVISLVLIVLVAALVGRTCARARPGSRVRHSSADGGPVSGGDGGTTVDVTDGGVRHGGGGSVHSHHGSGGHDTGGGHSAGGHSTVDSWSGDSGGGDSGGGGDGGGGGGGD